MWIRLGGCWVGALGHTALTSKGRRRARGRCGGGGRDAEELKLMLPLPSLCTHRAKLKVGVGVGVRLVVYGAERWRPRLHTSFYSPNLQHSPRPPPSTPTQCPASSTLFQPGHLYCIRTLSRSWWVSVQVITAILALVSHLQDTPGQLVCLCPLLGFLHPLLLQSLKASLAVGGTQTLSDSLRLS